MSKILNDITTNSISLSECLQRLLVIANKSANNDLAQWCSRELNGYKDSDSVPNYRIFKSRQFIYSGINGRFQLTNQPLLPGYLSDETIQRCEEIKLLENIVDVEKRKDIKENLCRDLSFLAPEVYKNTKDERFGVGVQCTSIKQVVSQECYTEIYTAVKTRIINLLCSFENMGIGLDNLDVKIKRDIKMESSNIFNNVIVQGNIYYPNNQEKKVFWNVLIPIITGVVSAIISGILVYLITNVWLN